MSYSLKSGDVWRVNFACDISSSNPNNWLRLPFIDRQDEANRFTIKLEYTIRECQNYPDAIRTCKETFQLLYVESDDPTSPPEFSELNYKFLKTIAPNSQTSSISIRPSTSSSISDAQPYASQFNSTTTTTTTKKSNADNNSDNKSSSIYSIDVDLPLSMKKRGIFLVFRDQGSCVSLLSIKVSYLLCDEFRQGLVHFPITATGSNVTDLVRRQGQCVKNSISKEQPYAYCQTNGNWFVAADGQLENSCKCIEGYYYSTIISQCLGILFILI
jgi:hypothetical protein